MAETVGRVHKLLSFLLQNTRGISVHPSGKFAILQLKLSKKNTCSNIFVWFFVWEVIFQTLALAS